MLVNSATVNTWDVISAQVVMETNWLSFQEKFSLNGILQGETYYRTVTLSTVG
jgi:hypothetical protein